MPLRDGVPLNVSYADGTAGVITSPVTNTVAGAMAIQEVFDNYEWVVQPGDPVAWAPYLRKDPLPGVPVRPVIIQFAKGDQTDSNPTATALLRAGNLADRATFYRYDLAFPQYQQDPNNPLAKMTYPHGFAALITSADQTVKKVALAAQNQIATFFASNGTQTIQPQPPDGFGFGVIPVEFFEVPIQGQLPEGLNYINPVVSAVAANGGLNDVVIADLNVPHFTAAVSKSSNVAGITGAGSTSVISSTPLTAVDQVFTDLARIVSDTSNAYSSALSPVAALWQHANAEDLQLLDDQMSWEAGAMGGTMDTLLGRLV
jgi:hypothetical protein